MKKLTILLSTMLIYAALGYSQVAINTDGSNPDNSAMLEVKSTNKGLLLPRVANVNAVSNPVAGLQVYDLSNQCLRYYNGNCWSDCLGISSDDANKTCGGTLTDTRDGQTYTTVQIGTQCWMAENLNIGTRIDDNNDQTYNGTIEKYCYDNNPANCDTYGGLYQWDEMMQYTTTEGTHGICPSGWHLPTDAEWKTLEMHLGMSQASADSTTYRGTDEGSKLAGNEPLWINGNLDHNSNFGTSGFTSLPGGYWTIEDNFRHLTSYAFFWSSSEMFGPIAWGRQLFCADARVFRDHYDKYNGHSVRCVRD